jgi:hypothetical protein
MLIKASPAELDALWYDGYGEYIMQNADTDYAVICNGDTLLTYMEQGYLWAEFLATKGLTD